MYTFLSYYSLVPRPHFQKEEKGLVNLGHFLSSYACAKALINYSIRTDLQSDWSTGLCEQAMAT